jgi:hypothetical protein
MNSQLDSPILSVAARQATAGKALLRQRFGPVLAEVVTTFSHPQASLRLEGGAGIALQAAEVSPPSSDRAGPGTGHSADSLDTRYPRTRATSRSRWLRSAAMASQF